MVIGCWWMIGVIVVVFGWFILVVVEFIWFGDLVVLGWVWLLYDIVCLVECWGVIVVFIGIVDWYWNIDYCW